MTCGSCTKWNNRDWKCKWGHHDYPKDICQHEQGHNICTRCGHEHSWADEG